MPLCSAAMVFVACSFSYDVFPVVEDDGRPDVTMNTVEYVRVRGGEPVVRIQAEKAERYEKDQVMVVDSVLFAQYSKSGQAEGAVGEAGDARVDLASGDVDLYGGVQIVVKNEDLEIDTLALSWRNEERVLLGGDDIPVVITRSDGSTLSGTGFGVSARSRTFEFAGGATGTYVDPVPAASAESPPPATATVAATAATATATDSEGLAADTTAVSETAAVTETAVATEAPLIDGLPDSADDASVVVGEAPAAATETPIVVDELSESDQAFAGVESSAPSEPRRLDDAPATGSPVDAEMMIDALPVAAAETVEWKEAPDDSVNLEGMEP